MGKVIPFRDKGVAKYVADVIDATSLMKGRDFEVMSIIVLDNDLEIHSLGGFLSLHSIDVFREMQEGYLEHAKELVKKSGVMVTGVSETPVPKIQNLSFYNLADEVNIDLAIELGFGVVRYLGRYMLYSPTFSGQAIDVVYEMLMLKVYNQLMHPHYIDQKLKEAFEKNEHVISSKIIKNKQKYLNRLHEIFSEQV